MKKKNIAFERRKERNASRVKTNNKSERLVFNVFRSNKNIYAQIVGRDGNVLVCASSKSKEVADRIADKKGVEIATEVGEAIAEKAIKAGISEVVFNRGPYLYIGRVKALADSARQKGLKF
jgi:large subunit ribosomal protein L18